MSCVIAIYKPTAERFQRCLDCVEPQVDEVIVVRDLAGILPAIRFGPKTRCVLKEKHDIGYGRKINYGVRNSNHRYLLFLNDDCYLASDAVAAMKRELTDGVGMVAPLLFFPDGTVNNAGKVRAPGSTLWHDIDKKSVLDISGAG